MEKTLEKLFLQYDDCSNPPFLLVFFSVLLLKLLHLNSSCKIIQFSFERNLVEHTHTHTNLYLNLDLKFFSFYNRLS